MAYLVQMLLTPVAFVVLILAVLKTRYRLALYISNVDEHLLSVVPRIQVG